jgi:predicted RNase H-like HicB family nuclease
MTYNILVQNNRADGYTATVLAFPGYSVDAPTRDEALARIYETIRQLLTEGEVVAMEVPTPAPALATSPQETFGIFCADPTFADFLQEVDLYRRARNQYPDEA